MLLSYWAISPDTIVQMVGVFVATTTFIIAQSVQKARDRKIARRDVYQKLELASIELFRFEADHLELIRPVWEEETPMPRKGTAEYMATLNYVCQVLNLFELAIKFRKDNTMPADIFGSWVAWFYLLLRAPGFPEIWEESKWNYLPQLRNIMDGGLRIAAIEPDPIVQESRFYEYVSHLLQCHVVKDWTGKAENNPLDDFWKSGLRARKTKPMTDAKQINIQWVSAPDAAGELAKLFITNAGKQYISHGELQEGRALQSKEWAPDLEARLTSEFETAIRNEPFTESNMIGAYQHNTLIGFILMEYTQAKMHPFATMADIIVDKAYRNSKVGEKLIHWAVQELKAHGIHELYAESNVSNEVAHAFLHKMGFRTISKVFRKEII